MFCNNCGAPIEGDGRYCPACGAEVPVGVGETGEKLISYYNSSVRLGYSPRISDPSYDRYLRKAKKWSFLFAGILALIAATVFPIYLIKTDAMQMPHALYAGLGLGGMFLAIAAGQYVLRKMDRTWDGTVVDKSEQRVRKYNRNTRRWETYMEYRFTVQRDDGKVYRHVFRNNPHIYDYYSKGDRVRHHRGFSGYEKYDKTRDTRILCIACLTFNDIEKDRCSRCGCALLK